MPDHGRLRQNIGVAVDNCIFTVLEGSLQVLLIQMKRRPFEDRWAFPGGLVEDGEALDAAAARILREQTGVSHVYLEQLYTFDDRKRDPSNRVVSVAYFSLVPPGGVALQTTEKYRAVRFWDLDRRPRPLAYDHEEILAYAQKRLQSKVQYTNVMFSLLPSKFTLSQLQSAYETVLKRSLDKRNFRKKVLSLGLVEASGERATGGRHRPAMLYRFEKMQPEIVEVF
ncbi:MAG TPA: NUDIX domain-containing protein [Vicinamibacteria bacterium]|nr:NUDIX domain-containing protein [Vicinamibacteria bacterium]